MPEMPRPDEEVAAELLDALREEEAAPPADLPRRAIQKVQASITARDLIDLTTVVFVLRFCAPIIDLVATMFGRDSTHPDRRANDD